MTATAFTTTTFRTGVAAAIRAPSLRNSQPWRFRFRDGAIEVRADPERRLAAGDDTGWATRIGCGAALFNLELALAVAGAPASTRIRPDPAVPDLVARLTPDAPRMATPAERLLHAAIPRRYSNRRPFRPDPVPARTRRRLVEAADNQGAWLELIIGTAAMAAITALADGAHRALDRTPAYEADRLSWTHRDALTDQDGAEPLVAVLGSAGDSASAQIAAGQALQRVLLTATDAGLAVTMLSPPIAVPSTREQLRLALGRYGAPQMVMRIGYAHPGQPTARRNLAEVIASGARAGAAHNWGATSAATNSR